VEEAKTIVGNDVGAEDEPVAAPEEQTETAAKDVVGKMDGQGEATDETNQHVETIIKQVGSTTNAQKETTTEAEDQAPAQDAASLEVSTEASPQPINNEDAPKDDIATGLIDILGAERTTDSTVTTDDPAENDTNPSPVKVAREEDLESCHDLRRDHTVPSSPQIDQIETEKKNEQPAAETMETKTTPRELMVVPIDDEGSSRNSNAERDASEDQTPSSSELIDEDTDSFENVSATADENDSDSAEDWVALNQKQTDETQVEATTDEQQHGDSSANDFDMDPPEDKEEASSHDSESKGLAASEQLITVAQKEHSENEDLTSTDAQDAPQDASEGDWVEASLDTRGITTISSNEDVEKSSEVEQADDNDGTLRSAEISTVDDSHDNDMEATKPLVEESLTGAVLLSANQSEHESDSGSKDVEWETDLIAQDPAPTEWITVAKDDEAAEKEHDTADKEEEGCDAIESDEILQETSSVEDESAKSESSTIETSIVENAERDDIEVEVMGDDAVDNAPGTAVIDGSTSSADNAAQEGGTETMDLSASDELVSPADNEDTSMEAPEEDVSSEEQDEDLDESKTEMRGNSSLASAKDPVPDDVAGASSVVGVMASDAVDMKENAAAEDLGDLHSDSPSEDAAMESIDEHDVAKSDGIVEQRNDVSDPDLDVKEREEEAPQEVPDEKTGKDEGTNQIVDEHFREQQNESREPWEESARVDQPGTEEMQEENDEDLKDAAADVHDDKEDSREDEDQGDNDGIVEHDDRDALIAKTEDNQAKESDDEKTEESESRNSKTEGQNDLAKMAADFATLGSFLAATEGDHTGVGAGEEDVESSDEEDSSSSSDGVVEKEDEEAVWTIGTDNENSRVEESAVSSYEVQTDARRMAAGRASVGSFLAATKPVLPTVTEEKSEPTTPTRETSSAESIDKLERVNNYTREIVPPDTKKLREENVVGGCGSTSTDMESDDDADSGIVYDDGAFTAGAKAGELSADQSDDIYRDDSNCMEEEGLGCEGCVIL